MANLSFAIVVVTLFAVQPDVFFQRASSQPSFRAIQDNITYILDSLQKGYDKRVRPNYGGPPVEVGVHMMILSISSVSEVFMDFTADMYFRQYWKDPRLKFDPLPGVEILSVSTEYLKNIWVPDTYFANEKSFYFHLATTSNEFLRITHTGNVQRSIRLTITASCPMNLKYFPLDRQLCALEIESYSFTMTDIVYHWSGGHAAVEVSPEVQLPQFRLLGYRQRYTIFRLATGNYSRMAVDFKFVRSMGYYLIQIYIPSGLIVIISWVSFWLNRAATPARVSLGVTTVLTMTTLMSSTNAALPKVSYIKSIDIFLGTCFVMVFASLLEYAAVGYIEKRIKLRKSRMQNIQKLAEQKKLAASLDADLEQHPRQKEVRYKMQPHSRGVSLGENPPTNGPRPDEEATAIVLPPGKDINKLYGMTPSDIDKYSRVVFPICFVCFNLMYWIIYLHISDVVEDDLVLIPPPD